MSDLVRADKWLWAVRLYKTRAAAVAACRAGAVIIRDQAVKPAREMRIDDVLVIRMEAVTRTIKVTGLIDRRVGAKMVSNYLEDQTPAEELAKARQRKLPPMFSRPKGLGRPTKKDRRLMDDMAKGPE
jgi:ribosome-associated heat shock protein Hsp15